MKKYRIIKSADARSENAILHVLVDDQAGMDEFNADYPDASAGSTVTIIAADGTKTIMEKLHSGSYADVTESSESGGGGGGGLPDVFWAKYGETTYDEVTAAVEANKVVMVKLDGRPDSPSFPVYYLPRYFMLADKTTFSSGGDSYVFYSVGRSAGCQTTETDSIKRRNNAIHVITLSHSDLLNGWSNETVNERIITQNEYAPSSKTEEMTQPVGKSSNGLLWTKPTKLYYDIGGSDATDGAATPDAVNNAIEEAIKGGSGAEVVDLRNLVFWLNQQSDFQKLMASAVSSPQTWVNNSFMAPAEAVPISVVGKIADAYTAKKSILLDLPDAAGGITPASVSVISDSALIVSWKTNAAQVTVDQGTGIATLTMFNLECSLATSGVGGLLRVWLRLDYSEQIPTNPQTEITITYSSDHGTTPAPQTVSYYDLDGAYLLTAADLPELEKPRYTFDAWYYDATFTNQAAPGDPVDADITLYAKWDEDQSE